MKHIKFTYVDSVSGAPITETPAKNGPAFPDISTLQFGFALESLYPTIHPILYGTVGADAETNVPGVIEEVSQADYDAAWAQEQLDRKSKDFTTAREAALTRINQAYEQKVALLADGYPDLERESWSVQSEEAAIVLGEDDKPTPWIDASAAKEGVTRQNLATRIQGMNNTYRVIHGELSGMRRLFRDQALAVEETDEGAIEILNAIQWPQEPEPEPT